MFERQNYTCNSHFITGIKLVVGITCLSAYNYLISIQASFVHFLFTLSLKCENYQGNINVEDHESEYNDKCYIINCHFGSIISYWSSSRDSCINRVVHRTKTKKHKSIIMIIC